MSVTNSSSCKGCLHVLIFINLIEFSPTGSYKCTVFMYSKHCNQNKTLVYMYTIYNICSNAPQVRLNHQYTRYVLQNEQNTNYLANNAQCSISENIGFIQIYTV